mmetsp:Transcript_17708/g.55301  ORF Transcript_17708/g.55301 Transcript_17708/m.55301 type:complete len:231 (+) Transcript_17708:1260-1952(+)
MSPYLWMEPPKCVMAPASTLSRSVHTSLRKSMSWDTERMVPFHRFARWSSSHSTASRSRWLVGSSRSSSRGWRKRARARDTRMRQPPERPSDPASAMSREKPRPERMRRARGSAASAPHASSASTTSPRRVTAAAHSASVHALAVGSRPSATHTSAASAPSIAAVSFFSSAIRSARFVSAASTCSYTAIGEAFTSCSTSSTSTPVGTGRRRAARNRRSVDLPWPLGPRRP